MFYKTQDNHICIIYYCASFIETTQEQGAGGLKFQLFLCELIHEHFIHRQVKLLSINSQCY